jgi:hypothetical protein
MDMSAAIISVVEVARLLADFHALPATRDMPDRDDWRSVLLGELVLLYGALHELSDAYATARKAKATPSWLYLTELHKTAGEVHYAAAKLLLEAKTVHSRFSDLPPWVNAAEAALCLLPGQRDATTAMRTAVRAHTALVLSAASASSTVSARDCSTGRVFGAWVTTHETRSEAKQASATDDSVDSASVY